jgi:hypothetical protein
MTSLAVMNSASEVIPAIVNLGAVLETATGQL